MLAESEITRPPGATKMRLSPPYSTTASSRWTGRIRMPLSCACHSHLGAGRRRWFCLTLAQAALATKIFFDLNWTSEKFSYTENSSTLWAKKSSGRFPPSAEQAHQIGRCQDRSDETEGYADRSPNRKRKEKVQAEIGRWHGPRQEGDADRGNN